MDSRVRDVYGFFSSGGWMQGSMECRYKCSIMREKQCLELDVRLRSCKLLVVHSQFFIFVNDFSNIFSILDLINHSVWNQPVRILVVSCIHCSLSHQVVPPARQIMALTRPDPDFIDPH